MVSVPGLSLVGRGLGRMVQGRATVGDGFLFDTPSDLGGRVSLQEARGLPGVGRGMRLIADIASELPIHAYRHRDDDTRSTERVWPDPPLLSNLDPVMHPGSGWVWAVVDSLAWWGNAWADATNTDRFGWPTSLPLLPVDQVRVDIEGGWEVGGRRVPVTDVVHMKMRASAGERLGWGLLDTYQTELKIMRAVEAAQGAVMKHGVPTGLLKIDANTHVTKAELGELVKDWMVKQRTRTVSAMKGVDFQRVGFNADELSMIPTREFNLRLASDLTGVPPYLLGVPSESRVYANMENEWANFIRTTLEPFLVLIEWHLSACLPRGQKAVFDRRALLKADAATRWAVHETAHRIGAVTVDEIRNAEDMPRLEVSDG